MAIRALPTSHVTSGATPTCLRRGCCSLYLIPHPKLLQDSPCYTIMVPPQKQSFRTKYHRSPLAADGPTSGVHLSVWPRWNYNCSKMNLPNQLKVTFSRRHKTVALCKSTYFQYGLECRRSATNITEGEMALVEKTYIYLTEKRYLYDKLLS